MALSDILKRTELKIVPPEQEELSTHNYLLCEIPSDCVPSKAEARRDPRTWLAIINSGGEGEGGFDVDRMFVERSGSFYDLSKFLKSGYDALPVEFGINTPDPDGYRDLRTRNYGIFFRLPNGNVRFERRGGPRHAYRDAVLANSSSTAATGRPSRDETLAVVERALQNAFPERWAAYFREIEIGWEVKAPPPAPVRPGSLADRLRGGLRGDGRAARQSNLPPDDDIPF